MNVQQLDGPRLDPRSNRVKQLVILLHGYGADGKDLVPLASQWGQDLPDAAFVCPNAPQFCENPPMGYQWFPLNVTMEGIRSTPQERYQGALATAPVLDEFIDRQLQHYGLGPKDLALAGFSQGAMMALHVGLRRQAEIAAIASFSGMLLGVEQVGDLSARPPVFLAHGALDEVVPFAAMEMTRVALEKAGMEVTSHVEQGVGHGIDSEAGQLAGEFLAHALSSNGAR